MEMNSYKFHFGQDPFFGGGNCRNIIDIDMELKELKTSGTFGLVAVGMARD